MHDLGTLGGTNSQANGVNSSGWVAGTSEVSGGGPMHGFLSIGGTMYDLNNLVTNGSGITITDGGGYNAINDLGQIAGFGIVGGQRHALLLTPTPEPTSAALLLGGGALLALRRRRSLKSSNTY